MQTTESTVEYLISDIERLIADLEHYCLEIKRESCCEAKKTKTDYSERVTCEMCHKTITFKAYRYTHRCTRADPSQHVHNLEYHKKYYLKYDRAEVGCPICKVDYKCFSALTHHLNVNKDCKKLRIKHGGDIEELPKFRIPDVKQILNTSGQARAELLERFYK